mgnify:CR=1 FL=1
MKLTSLYDSHVKLNAKIVPFAGYQMPVTYQKITEEYKAVRENCGMFDVSHMGQILIDGEDIRSVSLQQLRKKIALVSQDVYLFHGTIFENIAYGVSQCSLEQVKHASKLAELDNFISGLPDGYDTLVGEKGIKLSGGQRQRLSIARAILKDAPIMVFDEATSSVDTETERAIQANLATLTKGKTINDLVDHLLSYLEDKI